MFIEGQIVSGVRVAPLMLLRYSSLYRIPKRLVNAAGSKLFRTKELRRCQHTQGNMGQETAVKDLDAHAAAAWEFFRSMGSPKLHVAVRVV
eukprot:8391577-Pyramimonas_sp.AAC.1